MIQNNQSTARVLLVDDDPALLRSLARTLAEYDFAVETACCAAEAGIWLKHQPFDVVVCDQNMPGKSGLDFLANVRNDFPEISIMMLSGQVQGLPVAIEWAREIGVHDIFSKPCDTHQLAQSIRMAAHSRRLE